MYRVALACMDGKLIRRCAVCCSVSCSVLHCVAVCCAVCCCASRAWLENSSQGVQCVAVCCSVLQFVAVCVCVLQWLQHTHTHTLDKAWNIAILTHRREQCSLTASPMQAPCRTYEWVMSHMSMGHVKHKSRSDPHSKQKQKQVLDQSHSMCDICDGHKIFNLWPRSHALIWF